MVPEWLARKKNSDYYESPKVLGQLFRAIPLDSTFPRRAQDERTLDPSLIITNSLARVHVKGLPGGRLGDPDPALIKDCYKSEIIFWLSDELLYYARLNTLSGRMDRHLSEAEAFTGTISAPAKDDRKRRDTITRLQDQTTLLFATLRDEVVGYEETPLEEQARRAWAAWHAALGAESSDYGVKSFGWAVLGFLLDIIEQLNEEE